MRYVAIILSPLLLFGSVLALGFWLSATEPESWKPQMGALPVEVRVAVVQAPSPNAPPLTPTSPARSDPRVPSGLEAPLQAVAADINLCVPHSLERDLGPIDIDVRFTPLRGGAFTHDVTVTTSWENEEVERCIAEVFEETTFMPDPNGRYEPSEFVFHFPDDAKRGLLGMRFVR